MTVMAREFVEVSDEDRAKALRRAILGPDDFRLELSQGQRRALAARRRREAIARRTATEPQKP